MVERQPTWTARMALAKPGVAGRIGPATAGRSGRVKRAEGCELRVNEDGPSA